MKKILESLQECEGMMPPSPNVPAPAVDRGMPVSMNVSLNATGKEHVEDLINMMKNAGMGGAKEVGADMMPMRVDMERLRDIVDGPKALPAPGMELESITEKLAPEQKSRLNDLIDQFRDAVDPDADYAFDGDPPDPEEIIKQIRSEFGDKIADIVDSGAHKMHFPRQGHSMGYDDLAMKSPASRFTKAGKMYKQDKDFRMNQIRQKLARKSNEKADTEAYVNEPDEQYGDFSDAIPNGDDLHRKKGAYPKASGGDNAMALEQTILKALKADYSARKEGRVDELSPKTLGSYVTKVAKLEPHEVKPSREKGIEKAAKKFQQKDAEKESAMSEEQEVSIIGFNSGTGLTLDKAAADPKNSRKVKVVSLGFGKNGAPELKFKELSGDGPFIADWNPEHGWVADFD